ncbi:periplasmic heavy metal sensor [Verrucomicrobium sp. 3C]|uniref:periplasmic heavy metal sensor n=1 Tax=Verrucomicrobium sp. 3C TaxID=1134055 RepID=UPI00036777BE|nr:periplasmic heavy metal sensor [Verrucomicrobium sp. 3C]
MKRIFLLAAPIALIAALVYAATLFFELLPIWHIGNGPDAGLQWLRRELHLSDPQLAAIARLQEAYRPRCQAMCRQILAADSKLEALLRQNRSITPEILAAMAECDRLRSDCRQAFLQHVYAVTGKLSPQQQQHYLTLVADELLGLVPTPSPGRNASSGP